MKSGLLPPLLALALTSPASAQAHAWPLSLGVSVGMGPQAPSALSVDGCVHEAPLVGGLRVGWSPRSFVRAELEGSVLTGMRTGTCDAIPCPPDEPCLRDRGIGVSLQPVGARLAFEPRISRRAGLRVSAGAGWLVGDGTAYGIGSVGARMGNRSRTSLTLELEGLFFDAPIRVLDYQTGEGALVDRRSVGARLTLVRLGVEARLGRRGR